jgi:uncharacterized protein
MTVRERNIRLPVEQLAVFCRRNPIARLSLFGSALREDFSDKSDVDLLVELLPPGVGLIKFLGMQYELEDMIGRKVDLRTPNEFRERIRERILREAETLYVREN